MSEIVVPDTIEPVIGYKSLLVIRDQEGRPVLRSPQQQMFWPRGQKAVASHSGVTSAWGWKLVKGKGKKAPPEILASGFGGNPGISHTSVVYTSAASSGFSQASFLIQPPEKPRTVPPPGHNWSWEETPHPAASERCGCGIYIVSEIRGLMSYFKENCVVARVALWGRVTTAAFGARGEFAYPQEIIGWSCSAESAEEVAAEYDIPVRRDGEFEHMYELGIKTFACGGTVSSPIRVHAAKQALTTPQFTQAISSFQPSNIPNRPVNTPIVGGRKSTKRDFAEVGVWAVIMLFGMFGLNQFAGRPAGMIWWVLCLVGWALWLSKGHKRKENKQ